MAPVPRPLQELVNTAARNLGRSQGDAQPFAQTLVENWFDSPASLADSRPEELAALGIPLRFAQQLVSLAAGGGRQQDSSAGKGHKGGGRQQDSSAGKGHQGGGRQQDSSAGKGHQGGGGGGQGGGKAPGTKVLKVRDLEAAFRTRGWILGTKGRYVHHIQDETGVKVDLHGDSSERMELVFSEAPSGQSMQEAMKLGKELLNSVYGQYDEWIKEGRPDRFGEGRRNAEGKGGNSGGGERKTNAEKLAEAECQHTIEIAECDAAFSFRGKLLGKGGKNVREIEGATGALLQLKGAAGEPMQLELGADSEDVLQQALEMAEDLIAQIYADYDEFVANGRQPTGGRNKGKGSGKGSEDADDLEESQEKAPRAPRQRNRNRKDGAQAKEKVKVEDCAFRTTLDLQECDPGFSVRGRVLGPRGSKLRKIEDDSGAAMELQGKDGEGMTLSFGAETQEALDAAVKASEELLAEIYDNYANWVEKGGADNKEQGAGGNKGGNKANTGGGKGAQGKGGEEAAFKKILKLKDCDADFKLQNQIRGNKCENLHHIQDETRARLWLKGGTSNEPTRLEITANNQADLEQGAQMAKDLIKTIFNDYAQWKRKKGGGDGNEPAGKRQRTA